MDGLRFTSVTLRGDERERFSVSEVESREEMGMKCREKNGERRDFSHRMTASACASMPVPPTSPWPIAACASPRDKSPPSTSTGKWILAPGPRRLSSIFPPVRMGGMDSTITGAAGAKPTLPMCIAAGMDHLAPERNVLVVLVWSVISPGYWKPLHVWEFPTHGTATPSLNTSCSKHGDVTTELFWPKINEKSGTASTASPVASSTLIS